MSEEKDNRTKEIFEKSNASSAVMKNAFPAMAAMIMTLLYNLADTFFIGQTHDALLVAAVSVATPVFLIFMALGQIFASGGTSVISRAFGEGRDELAKKVSSFCMWTCVIVGVLMSLLFLLFMDRILLLVGASSETFDYAKTYLTIVTLSGPFVLISTCYSNVIRAEGASRKAMMRQVIGNMLNIILDPIMILTFGWGIKGAAIATVIGNVVGTLYYIIYFLRGKSSLSISPRDFSMEKSIVKGVLSIGIPASLGSLLMSLSSIIMNSRMSNYGDYLVAGFGVACKVTMITGMISIGLGQGVQPLLGYLIGSGNSTRYRQCFRFSLVFSLIISTLMTLICYIFIDDIVALFLTDETAFNAGVSFSKIVLSTSFLFGIYYVLVNALQAMGRGGASLFVNISRQGLVCIPALFILESIFRENGIILAQPVADVVSLIFTVILYIKSSKKLIS